MCPVVYKEPWTVSGRKRLLGSTSVSASTPHNFSAVLRDELAQRGMRNKDLAGLLGVSENSVSNWTTGQYQPRHARMAQIATALGVSIDHLHGATAPTPTAPPTPAAPSAPQAQPATVDAAAEQIVRGLAGLDIENALDALQRVTPPLMDIFSAARRYVDEH